MRNLYFLPLLLFFFILSSNAQGIHYGSRVTLEGKVLDEKTKEPIPFANIGFIGKGIGTVSDEEGNYSLTFAPATLETIDRLQFSVVGYESRILSKNESLLAIGKPLFVSLKPVPYQLEELVLGETKRQKSTIGDLDYDERIIGYWKDIEGLGGEILTKVKVRRKNTKLHNLKFKVLENGADSLLIRVNVYGVNRGLVGENLLKESIQYTLSTKSGLVSIPLDAYNIYVDENIIVGIELLKVYGRQIGFSLAGSMSKGISFVRNKSQEYYKPVKNTSMAFELDISTPERKGNSIDKRDLPDHITLYWDTSASTAYRDIDKELEIIESLLDETKEATVDVVKFSLKNTDEKTFYLRKGKADDILSYLRNSQYNGVGKIDGLPRPRTKKNAAILLVTAGQTILSDIHPDFSSPVFVITTNSQAKIKDLEPLVIYSDGDLLDGSKETVKELKKRYTHFIEEDAVTKFSEDWVLGTVSFRQRDSLIPLQGATVAVRGSYRNVKTSASGTYRISATQNDILTAEFPGMAKKDLKVNPKGKSNLILEPTFQMLDQVEILGKNKRDILIDTPTGKRNEDKVSYKNNVINEDEIYARHLTLGDILRRESNIQVLYDPFTRQEIYIFPRTYYASILTPQPPVVVIDGFLYQQNGITVLPQIDTQNIQSITTSSSIVAGNKYGSLAAGGVISITTKNNNLRSRKEKPTALVKGNDYHDTSVPLLETNTLSDVKQRLNQGTSLSGSKEVYFNILKSRTQAGLNFYMEAFHFFKEKDAPFALEIITSMVAKAPESTKVLRTVGYALQELQEYELAQKLYKEILTLAPDEIQSYRDLAKAYLDNEQYEKSFELYKTILAKDTEGLDFKPLQETAENELRRLLAFHKSKVDFTDLPNDLLEVNFKKDQRLVFEWNDPSLQFELQFVNPEGKYFKWDHTIFKNQPKVMADIKNGLMIQEFELDNLSEGKWIINLSVLEDSRRLQVEPYMRYTLYTDYATPQEKKETKIISLKDLDEKMTIDQINIKTTAYEI